MSSNVTVNGAPLEEFIDKERIEEIRELRESETRIKLNRGIKTKHKGNVSGTRSGRALTADNIDPRTTHVIICGMLYPPLDKAPFPDSGMSIFGALELDKPADEIKCHECGKWWKGLAIHAQSHGITARDYRVRHGIGLDRSLNCLSVRNRHSELGKANQQPVKVLTKRHNAGVAKNGGPVRTLNASTRASIGMGFSHSPELANLRGRCMAQVKRKILILWGELGRAPTTRDLRMVGVRSDAVQRLFGMTFRNVLRTLKGENNARQTVCK